MDIVIADIAIRHLDKKTKKMITTFVKDMVTTRTENEYRRRRIIKMIGVDDYETVGFIVKKIIGQANTI